MQIRKILNFYIFAGIILLIITSSHAGAKLSKSYSQTSEPLGMLLTWQQDPTTTMTIDWYTHNTGQATALEYKKTESEEWIISYGDNFPFPFSSRIVHRVELTGLESDTEYHFRIGESTRVWKFRTMPSDANRPIRFAAGGDVRTSKERMERMNRQAASYNPDFILWGGDLAYADGREEHVTRWYEFLDATMNTLVTTDGRVIPVLAGIGNHEVRGAIYDREPDHPSRAGLPPYRQDDESRRLMAPYYYTLIAFPGQPGYGVMDFGEYMSIILLDTDHSNPVRGRQTEWLDEVLSERQHIPHVFPTYHVPAWPSTRNPEGGRHLVIRDNWVPLFEEYGVKVAFENHDHTYKRTYPLLQGEIHPNGIVYIGDGAWGVNTREVGGGQDPAAGWPYHGNNPWYLKRASSERHFILGTIHGTHRHFLMVNESGEIIDEYPRTTHIDRAPRRLAEPWIWTAEDETP